MTMSRRECMEWLDANVPSGSHAADAQGRLARTGPEVTLTLLSTITNTTNLLQARTVGALRNLEDLYAQAVERADRAEDALKRVGEIVNVYSEVLEIMES